MRIIYTQDLQRKEKKNTRRNEETFLRNVSFQMKNPSLFRNLFFSRLKRSSKSSLLSIQTNPVNALYEFTIGQQEAFFPSPFLDYMEHGTNRWRSTIEYSRVEGAFRRLRNIYRRRSFPMNFSRNWIFGKNWSIHATPPRLLSGRCVSKYHVLHRQVRR